MMRGRGVGADIGWHKNILVEGRRINRVKRNYELMGLYPLGGTVLQTVVLQHVRHDLLH